MLPGVELARRRRVHCHGDVAAARRQGRGCAGKAHHHQQQQATAPVQALTGVVGPALAARIRLEEKLRGASPPSPSRWSRLTRERDGSVTPRQHQHQMQQQQQEESNSDQRPSSVALEASTSRAELRRTLSKADLCAVCLDEVKERQQRITRLPCSHKYHSDCVLPWLAIHPDCPCCRALVPSVNSTLS